MTAQDRELFTVTLQPAPFCSGIPGHYHVCAVAPGAPEGWSGPGFRPAGFGLVVVCLFAVSRDAASQAAQWLAYWRNREGAEMETVVKGLSSAHSAAHGGIDGDGWLSFNTGGRSDR